VSYGEILGDKSTLYIMVTLYSGYLIVLSIFHLVCILYCGCLNWFCDVRMCVCVCVLVTCVLVFTVFLYCLYRVFVLFRLCIFILVCSVYWCKDYCHRVTTELQQYYYYYYY